MKAHIRRYGQFVSGSEPLDSTRELKPYGNMSNIRGMPVHIRRQRKGKFNTNSARDLQLKTYLLSYHVRGRRGARSMVLSLQCWVPVVSIASRLRNPSEGASGASCKGCIPIVLRSRVVVKQGSPVRVRFGRLSRITP